MVRIRHIGCVLVGFNVVGWAMFALIGTADAETTFVPCCIDATADNTLPAPGNCFAPSVFGMCEDSPIPGQVPVPACSPARRSPQC